MKSKIIIFGSSGLIGSYLYNHFKLNYDIYKVNRYNNGSQISKFDLGIDNFEKNLDLNEVYTIVYCIGKAHNKDKRTSFKSINEDLLKIIIQKLSNFKISNFFYLSTLKVLGEYGQFYQNSLPNPKTKYSISKLNAEKILLNFSKKNNFNLNIFRIPIVIDLNSKGNVAILIKLIKLNFPLPFKNVKNLRSIVSYLTICKKIEHLIDNNSKKTFIYIKDGDYSTKEICNKISFELNNQVRFFNLPIFIANYLKKSSYFKSFYQKTFMSYTIESNL